MHPNASFHIADREEIAALVREIGFGIIVASTPSGPRPVNVPVLLAGDRLRFHVSRRNAVREALLGGGKALFVLNGPHAYISPDWYGLDNRVPTWNYVSVELEGSVRTLSREEVIRFLDDLSATHEARLAPKPAWTRDKMAEGMFDGLLQSITGFEMEISAWRGTAKIDQGKSQEVRDRIAEALEARGELAMAALMKSPSPSSGGEGDHAKHGGGVAGAGTGGSLGIAPDGAEDPSTTLPISDGKKPA
jgi:transcriptional regulator